MNPQFPLYIPSKGRYKTGLTFKYLEKMKVPYYIVVEDQEYKKYLHVIPKNKILVLDKTYQENYDTFDTLGDSRSKGPGAARNFAWDHSLSINAKWHWVMDDNIDGFYRLNRNCLVPVSDGTIFRCMEDFCLRYLNVSMAGPNYFMFAPRKSKIRPFIINTRIYSCNLIRNDVPFRWRGRYNEDTDLSLRMLKSNWCTVQFNAFLQLKVPTQSLAGGNTKEFYHAEGELVKGEKYARGGTLAKSQMQVDMHPDVSKLVWRFGRWHHYVDYSVFKNNRLIRDPNITVQSGINNYGMELYHFSSSEEAKKWEFENI